MPAKRCQSLTQKGEQCRLKTRTGEFCWRHAANPQPHSSYQPRSAPATDARSTVSKNGNRGAGNSLENIHEAPVMRDNLLYRNSNNSSYESVAAVVPEVVTTKVEDPRTPTLYQIREVGQDGVKLVQRTRSWKDWVRRPLRASLSSDSGSNVNLDSNQPENIIRSMNFSSKTTKALIEYLYKTREVQEHLYIACSPPNKYGERRVKVGRTADPYRRDVDYKKCGMNIIWSIRMEHTIRVEKFVLIGIKGEFKEKGSQSSAQFIREIQLLGRKVVCPCRGQHNDMFLTTANWVDSHLVELKEFIYEFCRVDKIDSENIFGGEVDEKFEMDRGELEEELGGMQEGYVEQERPSWPVRAKSEDRVQEIGAHLVKSQQTWTRGPDGRLIRV